MASSYSVAIIDDNEAVRSTMASLLECEGHRVLSFASGEAFLSAALPASLSCILLDMRLPGMSGLDLLRAIGERGNRPSVLVLTGYGDVPTAVEAMRLGAFDFLEKPYEPDGLLAAVESAAECHLRNRASLASNRDAEALIETLSERQRQVLAGIVKGRPNKLIAYDLGLSIRTVESYRAQLLAKLGVHSTAEAVRIAIAAGAAGVMFSWTAPGAAPGGTIQARATGQMPAAPEADGAASPNSQSFEALFFE